MAFRITGLDPAPFQHLFSASAEVLSAALAERVTALSDTGYPCRVSLADARQGETLLLVHHVSNDVARPFRMAHAIYVREGAERALPLRDAIPEMLDRRTLGLRAFDAAGMMTCATLAMPGQADAQARALLESDRVAYIHAHNAAYGCFLAAIERD